MFGPEVADIAMGYLVGLARQTYEIDRAVRKDQWLKPRGISLAGKSVALVGFGDIGRNTAKRLLVSGMRVVAYDPSLNADFREDGVEVSVWPDRIEEADFIIVTCALTNTSFHMLNDSVFKKVKDGVRIVNVSRGQIIDENALVVALKNGKVFSAALDVFEVEPLPHGSYLKAHERTILGSHNSSNTEDAVLRTSQNAIQRLISFLQLDTDKR